MRRRQLGQVIRDNLQTRLIILDQRHAEPGEGAEAAEGLDVTGAERQ